jgi:hypothetical protein
MRPGDSVAQLVVEALRALAASNHVDPRAIEDAVREPATLIDLAERNQHIVVLEDLHNGETEEVTALLETIARYARDSRWIITTRQDPALPPHIAEQVLALGAMRDADLRKLASSVTGAPTSDEIVRAARGSPWRLRQLAFGARLDDEEDLLVHVSADARRLLEHMVHLDLPLRSSVLATIAPMPPAAEMVLLERRGMVERRSGGLRLHDVTRATLAARPGAAVDLSAMTSVLERSDEPAAIIEAARLHLESQNVASAERLLRAKQGLLAEAGFAPRLWHLLEASGDERLRDVRRHVAVAVRTVDALRWATAQEPPDELDDRLAWLRALSLGGDFRRTAAAAREMAARALKAGDEAVAIEATLLEARALYAGGRPDEGVAILRACLTKDRARAARRDAMLARCLSSIGAYREALALVDDLERRLDLEPDARREVQQHRAAVLFSTGRLKETQRALGEGDVEISASPRTILREVHVAVEGGELSRANEQLEALRRFPALPPVERMHSLTARARLCVATGELDAAERCVDELLGTATQGAAARIYYWARVIRLVVTTILGRPLPTLAWPEQIPAPSGVHGVWLATYERLYALRRGTRAPRPPAIPEIVTLQVQSLTTDAEEALHDGALPVALEQASAARDLARKNALVLLEADAVRLRVEILACLQRWADVAREAKTLRALADAMPSPRYMIEADLCARLAEPLPDVNALRTIARATTQAPEAARRAQRLLGLDTRVDALDTLVVLAARKHWSRVRIEHLADAAAPGRPASWGIDLVRRVVHIDGKEPVSLRRHTLLLQLLGACALAGGPASKAQLAREIWAVPTYHPLRDDGRIQVAVSRLRKLLDEGGAAEHLLTEGDAYAIARPCWVLREA